MCAFLKRGEKKAVGKLKYKKKRPLAGIRNE